MKTLKGAKVGQTVTVAKLHGEGPVKRRIMGYFGIIDLAGFPKDIY